MLDYIVNKIIVLWNWCKPKSKENVSANPIPASTLKKRIVGYRVYFSDGGSSTAHYEVSSGEEETKLRAEIVEMLEKATLAINNAKIGDFVTIFGISVKKENFKMASIFYQDKDEFKK